MVEGAVDMMRRQFRAPTDYYCKALAPIDEQICALLAKRTEISQNNPGFPHPDLILSWCQQYDLKKELVGSIFASLYYEHNFLPLIEPSGFLKFVPVLKSVEVNGVLFAVTHIKQYKNASVVYVEAEAGKDETNLRFERLHFELFISKDYVCRPDHGCASSKGIQHSFVVIPPLPDDVEGLEFRLTIKPYDEVPEPRTILKESAVTIK